MVVAMATAAMAAMAAGAGVAQAPPAPGYRVVHGWPLLPEGRVLGSAAGVGVSPKGEVFVLHRGGRTWSEPLPLDSIKAATIAVFDARSGRFLREWGANTFAMPHGLTVDAKGNIWTTDVALQQVFKFSPEGKLLMVLGERGVAGADAGHFNRPTDVAVLPDGSFFVSDGYRNTRVAKFSPEGRFLFQWGRPGRGEGEFNTPHGIDVDAQGQIYVADRENDRVQVFDAEGRFLRQIKDPAAGRPYGVAVLPDGGLAIADGGEQPRSGPDRSGLVFADGEGRVRERLGRFGNQDGQFRMAHDVARDAAGAFYVVDIAGQRVQKFEPAR